MIMLFIMKGSIKGHPESFSCYTLIMLILCMCNVWSIFYWFSYPVYRNTDIGAEVTNSAVHHGQMILRNS